MSAGEQDLDAISEQLLAGLDETLDAFIQSREAEGAALHALIEQRLDAVLVEVAKSVSICPKFCNGSVSAYKPN